MGGGNTKLHEVSAPRPIQIVNILKVLFQVIFILIAGAIHIDVGETVNVKNRHIVDTGGGNALDA